MRSALGIAALGDLVLFLIFPILGAASHERGFTWDTMLRTTVPFGLAWLAIGLLAGAFAGRTVRSLARTLRIVPPAWIVAGLLGAWLRVVIFERPFEMGFAIAAIAVLLGLLTGWRVVLSVLSR